MVSLEFQMKGYISSKLHVESYPFSFAWRPSGSSAALKKRSWNERDCAGHPFSCAALNGKTHIHILLLSSSAACTLTLWLSRWAQLDHFNLETKEEKTGAQFHIPFEGYQPTTPCEQGLGVFLSKLNGLPCSFFQLWRVPEPKLYQVELLVTKCARSGSYTCLYI